MSNGHMIAKYLVASYAYYHLDKSIIPDGEFDNLAKDILGMWDTIQHRHKYLITVEDLKAGTLLLAEEKYPSIVKHSAIALLAKLDKQPKL